MVYKLHEENSHSIISVAATILQVMRPCRELHVCLLETRLIRKYYKKVNFNDEFQRAEKVDKTIYIHKSYFHASPSVEMCEEWERIR